LAAILRLLPLQNSRAISQARKRGIAQRKPGRFTGRENDDALTAFEDVSNPDPSQEIAWLS